MIVAWAEEFGVPLPGPVRDELLRFARLLLVWGDRINLTAAKSVTAIVADHLPDAFAIAGRLAGPTSSVADEAERIIDVGSGGGLPGIPLALLRPASEITLVEATGKKVAFLRTAIRELALGPRVGVEQRRIELKRLESEASGDGFGAGAGGGVSKMDGSPAEGFSHFANRFDVAISRAMLPPADWLPLGRRLVRLGGRVFCLGTGALTDFPPGLDLVHQSAYRHRGRLPGGSDRWVAELKRST
jgi:16S rRNA G527 N7-methylase RsmG